jgi:hypothetical protein
VHQEEEVTTETLMNQEVETSKIDLSEVEEASEVDTITSMNLNMTDLSEAVEVVEISTIESSTIDLEEISMAKMVNPDLSEAAAEEVVMTDLLSEVARTDHSEVEMIDLPSEVAKIDHSEVVKIDLSEAEAASEEVKIDLTEAEVASIVIEVTSEELPEEDTIHLKEVPSLTIED